MRKQKQSTIRHSLNGKTYQRASKGVSATQRLEKQIETAKARLSELYAKRREIIAASKPPKRKRISSEERTQQVAALALAGASIEAIVEKTQLSKTTIRNHLYWSVSDTIHEEFEKEFEKDKTTTWQAKEVEIKRRLYPGIKWQRGTYNPRSQTEPTVWASWPRQPIMHRNSDGSVMGYFYSDGTPAPEPPHPNWRKTA